MEYIARTGKQLLEWRPARVAAAGLCGLLLQTAVFELLSTTLGLLRHSTGGLVGGECGVLLSFLLNSRYSFNDSGETSSSFAGRLLRYHVVIAGSLVIQWACVFLAEQAGGGFWAIHGAYASGVLLGFISNYMGYRLWVWKEAAPPAVSETRQ